MKIGGVWRKTDYHNSLCVFLRKVVLCGFSFFTSSQMLQMYANIDLIDNGLNTPFFMFPISLFSLV